MHNFCHPYIVVSFFTFLLFFPFDLVINDKSLIHAITYITILLSIVYFGMAGLGTNSEKKIKMKNLTKIHLTVGKFNFV